MRAEELQVGDIFCVDKDVCFQRGTIVRIRSINADRVLPEHKLKGCAICVSIKDTVRLPGGVWLDFLVPIKLERIHLTKNGFKATNESDTVFVFDDGYEIRVEFDEGLPIANFEPCIYLRIEFAEKELIMPIEYLHELQQAMRLMGCDKKIEL